MAGQEGLEPPTAGFGVRSPANWATGLPLRIWNINYLTSLCKVCLLHQGQYFLSSSLSGVFLLFFVVE